MNGSDYLNHFVLPNFYFHLTAAYAVARHSGVEVGKRNFLSTSPIGAAEHPATANKKPPRRMRSSGAAERTYVLVAVGDDFATVTTVTRTAVAVHAAHFTMLEYVTDFALRITIDHLRSAIHLDELVGLVDAMQFDVTTIVFVRCTTTSRLITGRTCTTRRFSWISRVLPRTTRV